MPNNSNNNSSNNSSNNSTVTVTPRRRSSKKSRASVRASTSVAPKKSLKKRLSPAKRKHRVEFLYPRETGRKDISLNSCIDSDYKTPNPRYPCPFNQNSISYSGVFDGRDVGLNISYTEDSKVEKKIVKGLENFLKLQAIIKSNGYIPNINGYDFLEKDHSHNYYLEELFAYGRFHKDSKNRHYQSQIIDEGKFLEYHENRSGIFQITDTALILRRKSVIDHMNMLNIINDIRTALNYMHANGFAYFDTKRENILKHKLSYKETYYKLSNFETLREINAFKRKPEVLGSVEFMSPEMHAFAYGSDKKLGEVIDPIKNDTFCFGMFILQLLNPHAFSKKNLRYMLEGSRYPSIDYKELQALIGKDMMEEKDNFKRWFYVLAIQYTKLNPSERKDLGEELNPAQILRDGQSYQMNNDYNETAAATAETYAKKQAAEKRRRQRHKSTVTRVLDRTVGESLANSITGAFSSARSKITSLFG
jgi:hypothetical protein